MALILITHDMGVVAETADRVQVSTRSKKMEETDVLGLYRAPAEPRALLSALPENAPTAGCLPSPASWTAEFRHERGRRRRPDPRYPRSRLADAGGKRRCGRVDGIKLWRLERGKVLAIVGESGSGKSTLARIVALIDPASRRRLLIEGKPVDIARQKRTREMRSKVQMVFQNPYGSLSPRQKIGDVLMEPLA